MRRHAFSMALFAVSVVPAPAHATAPAPASVVITSGDDRLTDAASGDEYLRLTPAQPVSVTVTGPLRLEVEFRTNLAAQTSATLLSVHRGGKRLAQFQIFPNASPDSWANEASLKPSTPSGFYLSVPAGPQSYEFRVRGAAEGGAIRLLDAASRKPLPNAEMLITRFFGVSNWHNAIPAMSFGDSAAPADTSSPALAASDAPQLIDDATGGEYALVAPSQPVMFRVEGPTRVEVDFRANLAPDASSGEGLLLSVHNAGRRLAQFQILPSASTDHWRNSPTSKPSTPSGFYISVPAGPQSYEFRVRGGAGGGAIRLVDPSKEKPLPNAEMLITRFSGVSNWHHALPAMTFGGGGGSSSGGGEPPAKPASAPGGMSCVAVLPFENLSGDPTAGDSFTAAVSRELERSGRFHVLDAAESARILSTRGVYLPPTSDSEVARLAGETLGVQAVVVGNVEEWRTETTPNRVTRPRIAVNASLVSAANGDRLWSDSFLGSPFAFQSSTLTSAADQIARRFSRTLVERIGTADPLPSTPCWSDRDRTVASP